LGAEPCQQPVQGDKARLGGEDGVEAVRKPGCAARSWRPPVGLERLVEPPDAAADVLLGIGMRFAECIELMDEPLGMNPAERVLCNLELARAVGDDHRAVQEPLLRNQHKLRAYRWNLVDRYLNDLIFAVTEIDSSLETRTARFRLKNAFAVEAATVGRITGDVLCSEPAFRVSTAVLEHRTPCLAFAIEEAAHVNIWKNRLLELGLPVGPWLRDLKRAVIEKRPNDHLMRIGSRSTSAGIREMQLAALRGMVTVTPGQKIAYVTDVADTPANRAPSLGSSKTPIRCSSRPLLRKRMRNWQPSARI
jgi:hypothetical protein